MKKSICEAFVILIMLLESSIPGFAQVTQYTFSRDTATYVPITGGTALGPITGGSGFGPYYDYFFGDSTNLDGSSALGTLPGFPIGFNFIFDGRTFDRFIICSNGWIKLGKTGQLIDVCDAFTTVSFAYTTSTFSYTKCPIDIISGFGTFYPGSWYYFAPLSLGVGRLRYLTTGTAPNRKLVIQWEKFNLQKQGLAQIFRVNFQMILYETSNHVEFHYGDIHALYNNPDSLGIEIGMKGLEQKNGLLCSTNSSWDSTVAIPSQYAKCILSQSKLPANGLICRFYPGPFCTGTPNAGKAVASLKYVCANDLDTIALQGNDYGAEISYQWESSIDTVNWTTIPGKQDRLMAVSSTTTKYYRCIVSCAVGGSDTSDFVQVIKKPSYLCNYCQGASYACSIAGANSPLHDLKIVGTSFHFDADSPRNKECYYNSSVSSNYMTYDPVDSNTANLLQGASYVLNFTPAMKAYHFALWADYNHDGAFISSEYFLLADSLDPFVTQNILLNIPGTAVTGLTEFRFIYSTSKSPVILPSHSCLSASNWRAADFIFYVGSQLPCSSPPIGGIAVISQNFICASDNAIISLLGNTTGAGLTYFWQYSFDSLTWLTAFNSSYSSIYPFHLADTMYFRCRLTCNGMNSYSSILPVYYKPSYLCYCRSNLGGSPCSTLEFISHTQILGTSLDNADTLCYPYPGSTISVFEPSLYTTDTLHMGSAYTLEVTSNQSGWYTGAWIDYNHSGTYEANEFILFPGTSTAYLPTSSTFTIPSTATTGLTGLRVRSSFSNVTYSVPCTQLYLGEVEQYFITIDQANSVKKSFERSEILIMPNPVKEQLSIVFNGSFAGDVLIKLLTVSSQVAFTQQMSDIHSGSGLNVVTGYLPKGFYVLQVIHKNGIVTKKLILE